MQVRHLCWILRKQQSSTTAATTQTLKVQEEDKIRYVNVASVEVVSPPPFDTSVRKQPVTQQRQPQRQSPHKSAIEAELEKSSAERSSNPFFVNFDDNLHATNADQQQQRTPPGSKGWKILKSVDDKKGPPLIYLGDKFQSLGKSMGKHHIHLWLWTSLIQKIEFMINIKT